MAGEANESRSITLEDGRRVTIRSYPDGSLRVQVNGGMPYALGEAFLKGRAGQHAIIQLVPLREQGGRSEAG